MQVSCWCRFPKVYLVYRIVHSLFLSVCWYIFWLCFKPRKVKRIISCHSTMRVSLHSSHEHCQYAHMCVVGCVRLWVVPVVGCVRLCGRFVSEYFLFCLYVHCIWTCVVSILVCVMNVCVRCVHLGMRYECLCALRPFKCALWMLVCVVSI